MTDTQADLLEPIVREIIAAFERPQEGHELAQKLERVWPIIKQALLASVSQPQAEPLARARALVTEMQDACGIYHASMIGRIAAFAAEARRAALEEAALLILDCNTLRGDKLADILATGIRALASPAPQEETR